MSRRGDVAKLVKLARRAGFVEGAGRNHRTLTAPDGSVFRIHRGDRPNLAEVDHLRKWLEHRQVTP